MSEPSIKSGHEGRFTEVTHRHGWGDNVQGFAAHVLAHKEDYAPHMVEMANYAHNAGEHWEKGHAVRQHYHMG